MALSLEEAVTATLFDQSDAIADVVLKHHPLLALLDEAGQVNRGDYGYQIRKPVMYNGTAVGGFYSGYEKFDLDQADDATSFAFAIKQCYEPMSISGRDKRANSGSERLIDHAEMKMKAAITRLKNKVSTSILGDGTGSGGREFDGVAKAVSSTGTTGTYGGIDRAVYSWAQNGISTVTFTAANIQSELTAGIISMTRGSEGPKAALAGATAYKHLHSSLTAIQRINDSAKKGMGGFKSLSYDGVDFYFDGGYGGATSTIAANSVRLINPEYMSFDLVRGADFKPLEKQMDRPTDQDALFTVIIVEGNLCCSAPSLQLYMGA
jgi:hypothetical protein